VVRKVGRELVAVDLKREGPLATVCLSLIRDDSKVIGMLAFDGELVTVPVEIS